MQIVNYQLLADDEQTVIADLPKLAHDVTVRVWEVPAEYRENGFYISTSNDIPACDHAEPVFTEELPADETTKQAREFELTAQRLSDAVQVHLDSTVKARGYDNMISAATYATSSNTKFKAEGVAAVKWRDAVWTACNAYLADVQGGTKAVPTEEELIVSLPVISW
jgi:hypothetical protein